MMTGIEIDQDAFDFGHRLRELRTKRGLTQKEVADRLNYHINTISAYENNTRKPSYTVLKKLASLYHTSTDYILGFADREYVYIDDLPKSKQAMINGLIKSMREEERQNHRKAGNERTGD